jgi:hypothetical protein
MKESTKEYHPKSDLVTTNMIVTAAKKIQILSSDPKLFHSEIIDIHEMSIQTLEDDSSWGKSVQDNLRKLSKILLVYNEIDPIVLYNLLMDLKMLLTND